MIQLQSDYLIFHTADGEAFPCSAKEVTVEIISSATNELDPEVIQQASEAVLHYFKQDLGRNSVSVAEFAEALERVLRGLGLTVCASESDEEPQQVAESDLRQLACAAGKSFELAFFQQLRDELRRQLRTAPHVLRFKGLRGCVKLLAGAQRWNGRCRELNDQIIIFLRLCFRAENTEPSCALIVQ